MFKRIITQKSIVFIIALGLVLRLVNLNQSLWLDEAISVLAVKNYSLTEIVSKFIIGDVHPPFYYLFLKFWTDIFGYSEIAVRMPSVIFGVLTVFLVYKIGGKKAALFMALNPLAIYYSQEARMYALVMFLITAAVAMPRWSIIFLSLALYTDYLPWTMLPVFLLWGNFKTVIMSVILILPWLPVAWQQIKVGAQFAKDSPGWGQIVGGLSLKNIALVPVKFILGRISFENKYLYGAVSVISLFFHFLILSKSKNLKYWFWLLIPPILMLGMSFFVPVFSYHRILFVLPALCLLLAEGVKKNKLLIFGVVFISLLSWIYFILNPRFHREDWRSATAYINSVPGKVVMPSMAQSASLEYYGAMMNKNDSPVYLIRYVQELFDPQDLERKTLEVNGYKRTEEKAFNGVLIWKYNL